jgi:hypothetical protein
MAIDIKAVQCPHCGSIYKTETKANFYHCQSCGTDYYLDSDDIHIYHHHDHRSQPFSSAPPGNTRLRLFIFIGAIAFIIVVYLIATFIQPKKAGNNNAYTAYKAPRSYYSSFVYTNINTGEPVYMRLGTDYIEKGNNKSEQELHVQFNSALNGHLIADRVVHDADQRNSRCLLTFKTHAPDMIYAIGCSSVLLQVDTRNNRLVNITNSIFKQFPELVSGVAKLEFDNSKDMIDVMNNEGLSYHYFPATRKLVSNDAADKYWKANFNRHYFEFGYLGDYFDEQKTNQLIENRYDSRTAKLQQRDLTPGRKYFNPNILYQDSNNLIISVNITAAGNSPLSIQSIDVATGKIKWTLSPEHYDLYAVSKWNKGFAIEYRKGEEADYVHGVLVVSNTGKLVYNHQLSRTE